MEYLGRSVAQGRWRAEVLARFVSQGKVNVLGEEGQAWWLGYGKYGNHEKYGKTDGWTMGGGEGENAWTGECVLMSERILERFLDDVLG